MSEEQEDIFTLVENLLKEERKTKRDLAKLLNIKENSINRALKNPSIKLSILRKIANFLRVDITDLFPKKEKKIAQEIEGEYGLTAQVDTAIKLIISTLSEITERDSKTIATLVQFIADNFPDKKI